MILPDSHNARLIHVCIWLRAVLEKSTAGSTSVIYCHCLKGVQYLCSPLSTLPRVIPEQVELYSRNPFLYNTWVFGHGISCDPSAMQELVMHIRFESQRHQLVDITIAQSLRKVLSCIGFVLKWGLNCRMKLYNNYSGLHIAECLPNIQSAHQSQLNLLWYLRTCSLHAWGDLWITNVIRVSKILKSKRTG